jgi:hypothetical protein
VAAPTGQETQAVVFQYEPAVPVGQAVQLPVMAPHSTHEVPAKAVLGYHPALHAKQSGVVAIV